jgi:hypothetical protein
MTANLPSVSKIPIGVAQRKLEQTPSDLIEVPQAVYSFEVDDNVLRGPMKSTR